MDRLGLIMKSTVFAAAITFLLWGTPAFANSVDLDGDGVEDAQDNCSEAVNSGQDDTDGRCDANCSAKRNTYGHANPNTRAG
jgi:hypothetical protein